MREFEEFFFSKQEKSHCNQYGFHSYEALPLETGDNDMYAKLKRQYDATTLEFEYVVKWGHYTQDLDYWAIEEIDGVSIYTKVQSLYPL